MRLFNPILLLAFPAFVLAEDLICSGDVNNPCKTGFCFDAVNLKDQKISSGCAGSDLCSKTGCALHEEKFVCCCAGSVCNGKSASLLRARMHIAKESKPRPVVLKNDKPGRLNPRDVQPPVEEPSETTVPKKDSAAAAESKSDNIEPPVLPKETESSKNDGKSENASEKREMSLENSKNEQKTSPAEAIPEEPLKRDSAAPETAKEAPAPEQSGAAAITQTGDEKEKGDKTEEAKEKVDKTEEDKVKVDKTEEAKEQVDKTEEAVAAAAAVPVVQEVAQPAATEEEKKTEKEENTEKEEKKEIEAKKENDGDAAVGKSPIDLKEKTQEERKDPEEKKEGPVETSADEQMNETEKKAEAGSEDAKKNEGAAQSEETEETVEKKVVGAAFAMPAVNEKSAAASGPQGADTVVQAEKEANEEKEEKEALVVLEEKSAEEPAPVVANEEKTEGEAAKSADAALLAVTDGPVGGLSVPEETNEHQETLGAASAEAAAEQIGPATKEDETTQPAPKEEVDHDADNVFFKPASTEKVEVNDDVVAGAGVQPEEAEADKEADTDDTKSDEEDDSEEETAEMAGNVAGAVTNMRADGVAVADEEKAKEEVSAKMDEVRHPKGTHRLGDSASREEDEDAEPLPPAKRTTSEPHTDQAGGGFSPAWVVVLLVVIILAVIVGVFSRRKVVQKRQRAAPKEQELVLVDPLLKQNSEKVANETPTIA